jgi:hypothetical protein
VRIGRSMAACRQFDKSGRKGMGVDVDGPGQVRWHGAMVALGWTLFAIPAGQIVQPNLDDVLQELR